MLTVMGGVVEFERSIMLERQREGITKAEGVHKGRKPTALVKAAEVAALRAEDRSVRAIAEALGISVGSVHGMLKAVA